jgi:hypothetical protein
MRTVTLVVVFLVVAGAILVGTVLSAATIQPPAPTYLYVNSGEEL